MSVCWFKLNQKNREAKLMFVPFERKMFTQFIFLIQKDSNLKRKSLIQILIKALDVHISILFGAQILHRHVTAVAQQSQDYATIRIDCNPAE